MPDDHLAERRALRETLIWASRWLLTGGGERYRSGIKVAISSIDGSESVQFRERVAGPDRVPSAFRRASEAGILEFLLRTFLTDDERRIVAILAGGPRKGAVLIDKSKIERTRFYLVAANLVDRGVLQTDQDGYSIYDPLVLRAVESREIDVEASVKDD